METKTDRYTPLDLKFYQEPYNRFRRNKLLLLSKCLMCYERYQLLSIAEQTRIIEEIELSCYNHSIDKAYEEHILASWEKNVFPEIYDIYCFKITTNIDRNEELVKNESNAIFVDRIISAVLNMDDTDNMTFIKDLPKLSSQEIFPSKYQAILKKIDDSKNVEINVKVSAMYKCRRCKMSKCKINNICNRALDEGISVRISCTNCGFEFNA